MSSADIENKILENDQQIEPLLKAMDLIFENIQSEMVQVVKKWITEEVERSLTLTGKLHNNWDLRE